MRKQKLTRRGWIVLSIVSFVILLWLVDHINWVGDHYCFHSMTECYFPKGK